MSKDSSYLTDQLLRTHMVVEHRADHVRSQRARSSNNRITAATTLVAALQDTKFLALLRQIQRTIDHLLARLTAAVADLQAVAARTMQAAAWRFNSRRQAAKTHTLADRSAVDVRRASITQVKLRVVERRWRLGIAARVLEPNGSTPKMVDRYCITVSHHIHFSL